MFPIRDENPTLGSAYAVMALVAANVASWVFLQGLGEAEALARSVCALGLIPAELLGAARPDELVPLGEFQCPVGAGPAWATPMTSMFLHGGWFHIVGNLWFLWVFGDNVEDSMGHGRFVVFYLLCGLAAAAVQTWAQPESRVPMVGASGAIGGVMGAYLVLYPRVRVHLLVVLGFFITTVVVPAYLMLGYWFLIQVLGGLPALGGTGGGGVAFWAHVGGFAAGALLVFPFRDRHRVARHRAGALRSVRLP